MTGGGDFTCSVGTKNLSLAFENSEVRPDLIVELKTVLPTVSSVL